VCVREIERFGQRSERISKERARREQPSRERNEEDSEKERQ
jgi:hypothetical protein